MTAWRIKSSRTYGGVLSICLNYGIDPPDCPNLTEVWAHDDPREVVAAMGRELEQRFVHMHGSRGCDYRQCLDPTSDQVQQTCRRLRRDAAEDNLVLYYCGHGVPAPSTLGELWFFNETYTEYVPARVVDVASWLGAPRLMIFDCSSSERVISTLGSHFGDLQRQALEAGGPLPLIALGATSTGERLPVPGVFPADVFTACLTRPLAMAVQLSMQRSARSDNRYCSRGADILSRLTGTLSERRSPLGELNWVLTGITDAIAWALLPQPFFSRLFRQDVTLSAVLRNFVLASRVMWHLQCYVVSEPRLPACHEHPLWEQWDHTVDICFAQLQGLSPGPALIPFFADQLTAFKLAIDLAAKRGGEMETVLYLPVVLQALLSQSHRMRAMDLLRGFLCLGPKAVQRVLDVGVFQYLAKLLSSSIPELRSVLLHVWAVILSHDGSCQIECFKANGHVYFLPFLSQETACARVPKCQERVLAFLVYGALCKGYRAAQHACLGIGLMDCCGRALASLAPLERRWALSCLTQLVWCNRDAALAVCADTVLLEVALYLLHNDKVAEVRAASVALAGALFGTLAPGGLADAALASAPELLRRHGELHSAAESAWHGSASPPTRLNGGHAQFRCGQFWNEQVGLQLELVVRRLRDELLATCADVSPTVRSQIAHLIGRGLAAEPQRLVQRCVRLHNQMATQYYDNSYGGGCTLSSGGLMVAGVDAAAKAMEAAPSLDELTVANVLWYDASPLVRPQMVGPLILEREKHGGLPGQVCGGIGTVSRKGSCREAGDGASILAASGAAVGQHENSRTIC
jgi:regulator-associated protein of mTOR